MLLARLSHLALGRHDPQEPLGPEDDPHPAVLLRATAPGDEVSPEAGVVAHAELPSHDPLEATVAADGADKAVAVRVEVRLDELEQAAHRGWGIWWRW